MAVLAALPPRAGIFLNEQTAGPIPPLIAIHRRTYVLGTATAGDADEPFPIGSMDDFTNEFTTSDPIVTNSLRAYLTNTRLGLFFIRCIPYPLATVLPTTGAGIKSVTIAGQAIEYTATAGDTIQAITTALLNAINNNTTINALVEAEVIRDAAGAPVYGTAIGFRVRSLTGATFTAVAGTGTTVPGGVTTPAAMQVWDWVRCAENLAERQQDNELGFIVAPQAFYSLTSNQYHRTTIGNAMEAAARQLGWFAAIDPGNPTLDATVPIQTATQAVTDSTGYTAVRGHSAYFFPYLTDTDGDDVSPAMMMCAIALRRYEVEGIHQPPAGARYPLDGIAGVRVKLTKAELDLLAVSKVNPFINKRGVGYVLFDCYTRALDTNFRFINTRIILNCLERSIEDTVDASGLLFEAIGGTGLLFIKLRATIEQVVARFYEGNALYGVLPQDAYTVRCDAAMQNAVDLEQGIVNAEVFVVPAGVARQIRITVYRVQIGQMATALATTATAVAA